MPLMKKLLLVSAFALATGVTVFERVSMQSPALMAQQPIGDGDAPDKPTRGRG
ncbi:MULTISPECIES: hypothetical protein [Deinococcus]|uniref:hypothetical protein n=1 Tax=Deinococcus TaxID=1298 RepID=UPI0013144207|nr:MULTISPECIES: hypothetical protein [Deinococcus]